MRNNLRSSLMLIILGIMLIIVSNLDLIPEQVCPTCEWWDLNCNLIESPGCQASNIGLGIQEAFLSMILFWIGVLSMLLGVFKLARGR